MDIILGRRIAFIINDTAENLLLSRQSKGKYALNIVSAYSINY